MDNVRNVSSKDCFTQPWGIFRLNWKWFLIIDVFQYLGGVCTSRGEIPDGFFGALGDTSTSISFDFLRYCTSAPAAPSPPPATIRIHLITSTAPMILKMLATLSRYSCLSSIPCMTQCIDRLFHRYYVEIKCQLDATDDIYCRFYCMLNMFRGNTMPIIRSSRVLYRWSLSVVFGALVFRLSLRCGAEGYVSGLQAANRTHNLQLHTITTTWKPKHQIPQTATICIILSSSWWWA